MKNILGIICVLLLGYGCQKDEIPPAVIEEPQLEGYIKNLVTPDVKPPYQDIYYIHVNYTNLETNQVKELTFSDMDQNLIMNDVAGDIGMGMSMQGVSFRDTASKESLEINFYFNNQYDSTFNIRNANYRFADQWKNSPGANIQYYLPVTKYAPTNSFFMFMGTESLEYYFKITYIGNNHIDGGFHTKWKECCSLSTTYDVTGEFSIPDIRYNKD